LRIAHHFCNFDIDGPIADLLAARDLIIFPVLLSKGIQAAAREVFHEVRQALLIDSDGVFGKLLGEALFAAGRSPQLRRLLKQEFLFVEHVINVSVAVLPADAAA
jgi:hypothetical protein